MLQDMESTEPADVLLGKNPEELTAISVEAGLPRFSGKQLARWLYVTGAARWDEMTNLSKAGRQSLARRYRIGRKEPAGVMRSKDGTAKYLFETEDGHYVETVFIPDGERATVCVSCQVGCKMGCRFCMTGRQGYVASLGVGDILNQIYSLPERERLTNIVFMGQGEPLDNWENVNRATEVLTSGWGLAWSPRRITISTVGVRRGLRRLLEENPCNVAISLHHPLHSGRMELMPAEKAFPISEMVEVLREYDFARRGPRNAEVPKQRRLTFEYIVFDGVNDSRSHAAALVDLLRGLDCRINLIRFHSIPETPLRGVDEKRMVAFRDYLTEHGVFTTIRASRGEDIMAACGLLSTAGREACQEEEYK
ncbi:MAG TPA: 23S rRNA (adenine(2503)-C(2))-methyltransferase RlmN [Alloprevotella sp.]|nr:23S rRNA (adenine(2503)-C(2))-methyltransferase RlmN [Alloprevotella sp.]